MRLTSIANQVFRHVEICQEVLGLGFLAFGFSALHICNANAVPAFAEQTGQRCSACHVGGLGPQLTPFGREFKLGGYTMRKGPEFTNPLAGMLVGSFVHTQKDQDSPPAPHYDVNDNFTVDQASIFVAGGVGTHFGGFVQFTYDGVDRSVAWDQLDLRVTTHENVAGSNVLLGINVNNSPGVQDVWNTLPSWGFPYTTSDLGPSPAASPILSGALAQRVVGSGIYAMWDSHIYTEAGIYWAPGHKFLNAFGVDLSDGDALLKGAAPYLRATYVKDYGTQNFEFGAFALFAHLYPDGDRSVMADGFNDVGIDGSWQLFGDGGDTYQLNARYIHEQQNRDSSVALGDSANRHDSLQELHLDVSYYWHRIVGFTVSRFNIWGSKDGLLYSDNRTLTPNSTGVLLQVDYTPWGTDVSPLGPRFNVRVGMQYTLYTRFNGAGSNYDGLGHNASDNNTFRLFTWFEF